MTNLRALPLLLVLLLLAAPPPAAAQPPFPEPDPDPGQDPVQGPVEEPVEERIEPPTPDDVRRAEREIERARAELQEIAGPELLRAEPPKLPRFPDLGSSEEEGTWLRRLGDTPPEEWSAEDRELVAELLAHDLPLLAEPDLGDDVLRVAENVGPCIDLLRAARRFALRDRLALLEGDELAAVAGLEERIDLAERLALQRGITGPTLGTGVYEEVLHDVHWLVERPETPEAVLERLDGMLLRWRLEVPDPATMVALEGLEILAGAEERIRAIDPAGAEPAAALLTAPIALDFAALARACREQGCDRAVDALGGEDPDNPYRVIAHLLMPNFLHALDKLEVFEELTALAATAVVLRLEALELGSYPPGLDRVPPPPAVDPAHLDAMVYTPPPSPGAGARLESSSDRLLEAWPEARREEKARLLAWELPPVPERPSPGE